jgi:hypothetical protein
MTEVERGIISVIIISRIKKVVDEVKWMNSGQKENEEETHDKSNTLTAG